MIGSTFLDITFLDMSVSTGLAQEVPQGPPLGSVLFFTVK